MLSSNMRVGVVTQVYYHKSYPIHHDNVMTMLSVFDFLEIQSTLTLSIEIDSQF